MWELKKKYTINMKGIYKLTIENKLKGGNKFRLENTKNNKVSIFQTSNESDKLFNFLFNHALKK